ncbi:MAG TPA: IPT/TIG domain-containing protein [Thermoanaerobaculia bacterium]
MKRRLIVSLSSLLLACVAQAQIPPAPAVTISSVSPSGGPTTGGIDVTIQGTGLQPHIECFAPCPTTVTFGDTTVEPYRVSDTELTVKSPAHAAGAVDVKVTVPGNGTATATQAFVFSAASPAMWEPVLIPVYIDSATPGANGSLWRTNLWIHNGGTENLQIAPWPCSLPPGVCAATFPSATTLTPGQSLHNLPSIYAPFPEPGRIVYLNRTAADDAAMNLRVVDDSGIVVDAGTEVPLVRERNLLTKPATFLNVPLLNTRLLLRIYDLSTSNTVFHVTVFGQSTDIPADPFAQATLTAVAYDSGDFHVTPAYAEYAIVVNLGPILLAKDAALRVQVTPMTPGSRYWAFVSATNNTTNHVTLITPQ